MSNQPDIRIKVGAYTGVDNAPIYDDIKKIRDNINKKPPKIALSLNTVKTKQNLALGIKEVLKDIQLGKVNIKLDGLKESTAKNVKNGIAQGIKSYSSAAEIKALNKMFVGDRSKTDPIRDIQTQLLSNKNVSKVSISGVQHLEKNKQQIKSFAATITDTTGKVQTLNFEMAKIGKRRGFVESDTSKFKVIRDEAYKTSAQLKKLFDESAFTPDGKNPIGIKGVNLDGKDELAKEFGSEASKLQLMLDDINVKFKALGTGSFKDLKTMLSDTKYLESNETKFRELAFAVQEYDIALKNARNEAKNDAEKQDIVQSFDKKFSEMSKFGFNNSKFKTNSNYKSQYDSIMMRSNEAIMKKDTVAMKELSAEFDGFSRRVTQANLLGQSFGDKLKQQLNKLGVYFSAATLIMSAWRGIKTQINNVIQLDSAVTDLQIATGYTRKETQALLSTYSKMGKELGATTKQVAEASDAWLRQGYSVEDTNTLIKNSMMLSKLGQIDSADATKALTSAMKGYNKSVQESEGIVDKFSAVDMSAAVSAGYLATAMAETATSARLAGISMDELIGYIATVGEVTQDGAESVGKQNCLAA